MPSSSPRCAIRGSINNDEYFYVHHISNPGETISSNEYKSRVGGKGANQAIAITLAGGKVDLYATVGKDGGWVKDRVRDFGLETDSILVDENVPTGRAIIQVAESGENSIILFPGANYSNLHEATWSKQALDYPPPSTHLLLQNEITYSSTLSALHSAHSEGTVTVFNPSPMPSDSQIAQFPWNEVDWLVVNEGEAVALYNVLANTSSASKDPKKLLSVLTSIPVLSKTNVICTLGSAGVLAFLPHLHASSAVSSEPVYLPAARLQGTIRDTTGAGDCFLGYFVAGLMELHSQGKTGRSICDEDVRNVLRICVQAAGMCVERPGTIDSIPLRKEVGERLKTHA